MIDTFRRPALLAGQAASAARPSMAIDIKALGLNLVECRDCQSRWFTLACAGEAVHRFLVPRLITTVVTAVALWVVIGALA